MTTVVHRDLEAIGGDWDELAERLDAPPFLRPGWFAAWGSAFGGGRWEIVALRRAGRLVAVLALRRRRGALLSAANWHTPWFGALAEDSEAIDGLAEHLTASAPPRLDLSFLLPADPLRERLRVHPRSSGLPQLERVIERSPFVDLSGTWEEFEAGLPSKRRADVRRRRRRLDEEGEVRIAAEEGDRELAASLAEGFEVEALGWKGSGGTAIASDPSTRGFYEQVAAWAAARGWLRLWFLRLDGRPLAFAYCLVHAGVQYILKVGFDPRFGRYAPGTLLTREMLAGAFEAGHDRYEFLGQPDAYKLVWTDSCHEMARLQVFSRTPAGSANRMLWEHGRPAALRTLARVRSRARGRG